jgi:Ca2+-binding RTX toxin-like protein
MIARMHRAWRPAVVMVLVALTAGGAAEAARAGTASGRPAQFTAGPGEINDLTVDAGSGGAVQFVDAAEFIVPGLPWCTPFPLGQALCDPDGDPRDFDGGGVGVDLADRDDRAMVRWIPGTGSHPGRIAVTAGAGDDRLESSARGLLHFEGGAGNAALVVGPTTGSVLLGGAGADLMAAADACCNDSASYNDHGATGVRVTLDAQANDGEPGEGDDVRTNAVTGSPGPDRITGDANANSLAGSGGADALDGGGGDDQLNATLQYRQSLDRPDGPDGRDAVTCGPGVDEADADANDRVAIDCEHIRVDAYAGPQVVADAHVARADRGGLVRLTYRMQYPFHDIARASRTRFRLVDRKGRAVSSSTQFVLGGDAHVARVRVRLHRATRRRLARSRSGALRLIAQRVSRDAEAGAPVPGYAQFNALVTIRRPARR